MTEMHHFENLKMAQLLWTKTATHTDTMASMLFFLHQQNAIWIIKMLQITWKKKNDETFGCLFYIFRSASEQTSTLNTLITLHTYLMSIHYKDYYFYYKGVCLVQLSLLLSQTKCNTLLFLCKVNIKGNKLATEFIF